MTEQEAKMWIKEVTNDFVEIGYTMKEANALAWAKFLGDPEYRLRGFLRDE